MASLEVATTPCLTAGRVRPPALLQPLLVVASTPVPSHDPHPQVGLLCLWAQLGLAAPGRDRRRHSLYGLWPQLVEATKQTAGQQGSRLRAQPAHRVGSPRRPEQRQRKRQRTERPAWTYSRGRGLGAEYRSTELTPLSGGIGERRSAESSNPGFFATIRFWACSSERGSKAACSFESECSGSFGSECACSFGSECACRFGSECGGSFGSGCYGCSSGPCFSSGDGGFRFLGAAVARRWSILKEVQSFPWDSSARHTIQRCCWFGGAGSDGSQLKCWEQLLIRALREESERRWREVVQIGGLAPPSHEAEEPRPLLSHYYGVPPVEQMYDSVAMLGVPGFLLRTLSNPAGLLAGNVGVGGGHGTTGQERLPFPSEMAEETPPIRQISSAPFPEPREVPKVEKPLGIDQSTQTQEDQDRWNLWLHRCLVGKGLTEYGVTQADLTLAKDLVTKMDLPSQRRDKRWKQRQQQADPLSVLLYLQTAERCLLSYTRSPTGYAGLIGGMPSRQLETPQGVFQLEVRKAWDLIECSVFVRMGALQQKANERRARQRARSSIRAASAKSSPQPRLPSSSASSSSSGEENVSSYAPAEREAFGRLSTMRASGGKLWQTVEQLLGFAPGTLDHSVERAAPQEASAASGSVASGAQAAVDPPSPTSMAASLAPGEAIASTFGLPRVPPVMDRFQLAGVPAPPDVPARRRLLTPPRAPPNVGQTEEERSLCSQAPWQGRQDLLRCLLLLRSTLTRP